MKASEILQKAEELQAAQLAAKQAAVKPLAAILARRIQLQTELSESEVPYGKAYVEAEAAGWSAAELASLGAAEPTHRPRRRARPTRQTAVAAADSGTEIPSQNPTVNA
ncbi:hypothetical protein [Streptomyces sp. NBC_01006]|uniref:hypothetical protein n=1 Tax=Streptomyces sp. NBC_01006 TaxID=2903716 RepID=UPI002F918C07|nr:hypothetical protein OG509_42575 [Streptomyces sp. NBC_01006]